MPCWDTFEITPEWKEDWDWFTRPDYWRAYFAMMARNRYNVFTRPHVTLWIRVPSWTSRMIDTHRAVADVRPAGTHAGASLVAQQSGQLLYSKFILGFGTVGSGVVELLGGQIRVLQRDGGDAEGRAVAPRIPPESWRSTRWRDP